MSETLSGLVYVLFRTTVHLFIPTLESGAFRVAAEMLFCVCLSFGRGVWYGRRETCQTFRLVLSMFFSLSCAYFLWWQAIKRWTGEYTANLILLGVGDVWQYNDCFLWEACAIMRFITSDTCYGRGLDMGWIWRFWLAASNPLWPDGFDTPCHNHHKFSIHDFFLYSVCTSLSKQI